MNPYYGQNFLEFFLVLFQRLGGVFTGTLPLATDELQMAVLIGVSVSTAMVGTFLVLRRMAMLANSLSHSMNFFTNFQRQLMVCIICNSYSFCLSFFF